MMPTNRLPPLAPAARWGAALVAALLIGSAPLGAQVQPLPWAVPEQVGVSSERLERLTRVLDGYAQSDQLAGGVALVARHGRIVYLHAFGHSDREAASPMGADAIFRIASQTKALVSVAVMMLQEEGLLLISDPVSRYLPEFATTSVAVASPDGDGYDLVAAARPITIRDLLTHTSGIGYGSGLVAGPWREAGITGWYFADRDEPIGATVSRMASLPASAQPGERWVYGYSTDILGALIERVTGETLETFLQTRILDPLVMTDTHFYLPPSKADRLATVYSADPVGGIRRAPDATGAVGQGHYVQGPRRSFSGGAGLVSTAGDYARFLQMLLNGGSLDEVRILSPSSVQLMTSNHIAHIEPGSALGRGMGFGLGFQIIEDLGARGVPGSVGEYGWGGAYHSTYWVNPSEQLVVVYMTQLIPAGGVDDHGKLRALVYQALVE